MSLAALPLCWVTDSISPLDMNKVLNNQQRTHAGERTQTHFSSSWCSAEINAAACFAFVKQRSHKV